MSLLVFPLACLSAACEEPIPAPPLGKSAGEACRVSTECAAGLRCIDDVCMSGTCTAATDCRGTPPNGCASWACLGGLCEAACVPDSGARDAEVIDLGAPDAEPADARDAEPADAPSGDADPADAAPTDADPADADPADADPLDAGPADADPLDADPTDADPTDADPGDAGPVDLGAADSGEAPDAGGPPDAGACDPTPRAPAAGDLMVNEVLADPGDDLATGDANGDGVRDAFADEFVEIANVSSATLELAGVRLSDGTGLRHVFAARTLACGQVVAVFGGGNPAHPSWRPNWVAASSGILQLNNAGDQLRIGTSSAAPANVLSDSYGNAAFDQSLVRTSELVPGSPLIPHSTHPQSAGRPFSPGARADGTAF